VANNVLGEHRAGSQLARAVQVGRKPPTLWYLGGGIRIGVHQVFPGVYLLNNTEIERSDSDGTWLHLTEVYTHMNALQRKRDFNSKYQFCSQADGIEGGGH
jgi:hypothetical protein